MRFLSRHPTVRIVHWCGEGVRSCVVAIVRESARVPGFVSAAPHAKTSTAALRRLQKYAEQLARKEKVKKLALRPNSGSERRTVQSHVDHAEMEDEHGIDVVQSITRFLQWCAYFFRYFSAAVGQERREVITRIAYAIH